MRALDNAPPVPSDDKRWKIVRTTMRKNGYRPDALIESLHAVQEMFGHLNDEAFQYVASTLRLPLSHVYGVASFYHYFNMEPLGEHSCIVCTGTACFIKGVPKILDAVEKEFNIKPGQTTEDGKVTLLGARCVGACGLAPVVIFDGEFAGKMTPEKVVAKIREWKNDDAS